MFLFYLRSFQLIVKCNKELIEPEHNVKLETLKKIPILLSCISDYPMYECSVKHIHMPETYLFQVGTQLLTTFLGFNDQSKDQ